MIPLPCLRQGQVRLSALPLFSGRNVGILHTPRGVITPHIHPGNVLSTHEGESPMLNHPPDVGRKITHQDPPADGESPDHGDAKGHPDSSRIEHPDVHLEILLVEDSPDDAELMEEALLKGTLAPVITVAEDGEEAMAYLLQQEPHLDASRPHLILLDLHLPRKTGHEVLAEIKNDTTLQNIPIVIMTSFDINKTNGTINDLGVKCVRKPVEIEQFEQVVEEIESFWFQLPMDHRTEFKKSR